MIRVGMGVWKWAEVVMVVGDVREAWEWELFGRRE